MTKRRLVFLSALWILSVLGAAREAEAQGASPQDERATSFVAGQADASEAFGDVEGAVLFGAGAASIAAMLIVWLFAAASHRRNHALLEKIESEASAGFAAGKGGIEKRNDSV